MTADGDVTLPRECATLNKVAKGFGATKPALEDVSGSIFAGQITGIVGPDGAGKTTLIRLMTALMQPDTGSVAILGMDTGTHASQIQAAIGYMPQRFGLYEDLSIRENLTLYADLRGLPHSEREATFENLLEFTDLKRFSTRLAGKLSGGMKQKLGLACALLKKPRLLLLDEPGVGVDPISRRDLWKMVENLTEEGIGVVWSTAYLDEAEACDRVLLLNEGRVLFSGSPGEMTERVTGRVFRVKNVGGRRRGVLAKLLDEEGIVDGGIQGDSLRIVTKSTALPVLSSLGPAAEIRVVAPRFEDAFVDMLGGGPGGKSKLAESQPAISRADNQPVIEAKGLVKRFGDFVAADNITFDIPAGEIFGLLGPNGAGKSTTFKMLCGLLVPTGGEGRVAGFDLRKDAPQARNMLGYMAQKFSLYGDLSVRQNLDFFAGVYGLTGAKKRERIELMTSIFDFGSRLNTSAGALPLGLKQRLALACAVIHEPKALFLDEPTSGVDPITRREFWTHINGLVEKGVTVLVTTHFMDEAEYCDRISLIYRGRSIALGSPDELKSRTATTENADPTMEDAFIALVKQSDMKESG
ncbi:ATP-binding cassette domain-containing protein [Rhizobium sp. Root1220]|uniref:ATP-binding cassette domain-containing protein n=1 Tax=Rhizobium sp. Root1220 TaxID=1736432 RepID=UPI0006F36004|nr:ATP-binding cassette domain-containing protein [Rhizobium sp. Root1220]KQV73272.1 multidrug ABC transporter ATP-binding protein [Rhizobium sp. Root1220]